MDTGAHSTLEREFDSLARPQSAAPASMLLVLTYRGDVRIVPLAAGEALTVGRAEPSTARFPDPSLSRTHAEFRCEGERVIVTDLDSRNGTRVGRCAVREAVLCAGDTAVLGSVSVSVQSLAQAPGGAGLTRTLTRPAQGVSTHIVRTAPAMVVLQRAIERAAQGSAAVLLLGERGTGKELLARELHELSPRREGPLQVLNCSALPDALVESFLCGRTRGSVPGADRDRPGVFEQARGGTLLLDEVGELSACAQAALLRVLERGAVRPVGGTDETPIDARIVATSHHDLTALVAGGQFDEELQRRLAEVTLQVPPLRERPDEIPVLAEHFLTRLAAITGATSAGIEPEALARLVAHAWPANVRELQSAIEHAFVRADGDALRAGHIQFEASLALASEPPVARPLDLINLRASVRDHEARLIREALARSGGNQRRAAALLVLPLRTLERKLANLGQRSMDGDGDSDPG